MSSFEKMEPATGWAMTGLLCGFNSVLREDRKGRIPTLWPGDILTSFPKEEKGKSTAATGEAV